VVSESGDGLTRTEIKQAPSRHHEAPTSADGFRHVGDDGCRDSTLREWKQHSRRYPSIFDVMRERGITGVRSAVTTLPLSVVLDRRATYAKGVS
jgi:hypothetical protein